MNVKNNRYAYMAYMSRDKAAAEHAFALIGDNPDHGVWHDQDALDRSQRLGDSALIVFKSGAHVGLKIMLLSSFVKIPSD